MLNEDGSIQIVNYPQTDKNGEKVQLAGFGNYEIKAKPAHEGINPATGAKVQIAASKTPVFKFGKTFKDSFNA